MLGMLQANSTIRCRTCRAIEKARHETMMVHPSRSFDWAGT
jgi:hypothetical protein